MNRPYNMYEGILREVCLLSAGFLLDPPSIFRNVFYRHNFTVVEGTVRVHWHSIMPKFTHSGYDEKGLKEALANLPNVEFDDSSLWFTIR